MGIYGFSQSEISKVVAFMPDVLHFSLDDAIKHSKEFHDWLKAHKNIWHAVEKLEGIMSHFSTHAGGVIICEDLTKKLPVTIDKNDGDKMVVAYDKKIVEELGHYKFDILGLNSLTVMKDALDYLPDIDWHKVDFDDINVYKTLCTGDVLGVFQLSDQKDTVVEQQPRCFEDLIAINALIRPGVGDWNEYIRRRRTDFKDRRGLSYLKSTNGIIVYQEQYLLLASTYAGWDIAYSDKHIRKNKDICADVELANKFLNDALEKGHNVEDVVEVWKEICDVVKSGYGFNRSHSTSYAMLSFQTAYLKHYHPREFYAAYMSQKIDDTDALQEVLNLLRDKSIKVYKPDINKSTDKFAPFNDGILFPLTAIKGVGDSVIKELERLKPITSLDDLIERRTPKFIKKTTIEALIKSGTFCNDGESIHDVLLKVDETLPHNPDYVYEKESLGFYISSSPFDGFDTPSFDSIKDGQEYSNIVEVTNVSIKFDKNGNEMAFISGVNKSDTLRFVVFSSTWKKHQCNEGDLILVRGRKDKSSTIVNSLEVLK